MQRSHGIPQSSLPYWLSGILCGVSLIGSAAGFFVPGLFEKDNLALAGCARGTALAILVVALPVLVIGMIFSSRGSVRARLTWLGMLTYIFYNSVYFTFSATFNRFFLVFLAMLSLSGWSLLVFLRQIDIDEVKSAFSPKTPTRFIAIVLLFPVLIFLGTDLREVLTSTISNVLPPSIVGTQLPTNHFHVVDLAFLVPLYLLAAAWLWQRRPWGFTLAGMLLSYYTIELLGIGFDQWFGGTADPGSTLASASAAPAFFVMATIFIIILMFFLRFLHRKDQTPAHA